MISKKMEGVLNEQIKHELESSYIYLAMAAYFHEANFDGMAHWMRVQVKEEMDHAMKFFDHIIERDGNVELVDVKQLKKEWSSPLEAFKDAYDHEKFITGKINDLVKLAREEKDYAAEVMLQWFVDEQVEEEANALKIVRTLERIGDSGNGLIMLDRELGKRE